MVRWPLHKGITITKRTSFSGELTIKYSPNFSFSVLLASLLFFCAAARGDNTLVALADSLYAAGSYDDAITEYERHLFIYPEDPAQSEVLRKESFCHVALGDWIVAISSLQRALEVAPSDNVRSQRRIDMALIYAAMGDYSRAEIILLRVAQFKAHSASRHRPLFLLCFIYLQRFEWDKAKSALGEFLACSEDDFGPHPQADSLSDLLAEAGNQPLKSPRLARWLSTFVPGAGQLYSGKPRSAANAFLLNGSLAFLVVNLARIGQPENTITPLSLLPRYYNGNRSHAARLAEEHNAAIQTKYRDAALVQLGEIAGQLTRRTLP